MITDKIKELEAARAKIAAMEDSIAADLSRELAALPAKYGFESAAAFIAAVKGASGGKRGRKKSSKVAGGKRKRAVITDAIRSEVKKMAEAKKTGAEIAKALGISLPSVQNVKKALGLVKTKKKG